jgi:nicotinate-nucleotide adenylyltransferase
MLTGIFGGAFDPIHRGHLNLAENILKKSNLDKILFIPTARPPHKPDTPVTPFIHRINMVKLAISNNKSFEISDIENKNLDQFSYSILTVKRLKKIYPTTRFSLIIGGDSLKMLHTWYKAKELVDECNIISYPRPGTYIDLPYLEKKWPKEIALKLFNSIINLPLTDISSTTIRKDFYRCPEVHNFLPQNVAEYISKYNFYKNNV